MNSENANPKRTTMLKHMDDIRKSAKERAQRRWKNYQVEKEFKAAQQEAANKPKEPKPIEPSDTIEGKHDGRGSLIRAQTKFAKDIREMMVGHSEKALAMYRHSLEHKRYLLLKEKLRRLLLAQARQKELKPSKNLFE
jgi:hypothetical protein